MSAVLEAQEPSARYLNPVQPALVQQFGLLATASGGMLRLRELVLALAVKGKLVPQDPNDAPADALLVRVQARRRQLVAEGKIKASKSESPSADQDFPFVVPAGWEWICAADACVVITDGDHQAPPKADAGVPFLVIGDVRDGSVGLGSATRFVPREYFDALDWGKKPLQGDILYTTVGSLGIPVPVVQQDAFCFQRHIALLRPGLPELQAFLALALQSRLAFDQAESGATGIAQKTVPLSVLRSLRLPLPPLAEQARIVARVDELMRLCDALETKGRLEAEQHARLLGTLLGTLTDSSTPEELAAKWQRVADHFDLLLDRPEAVDALEQTILHLAVRGLLVLQDPSDETASILLDRVRSHSAGRRVSRGSSRDGTAVSPEDGDLKLNLPPSWEEVQLSDLCTLVTDGEHATPERCVDPTQVPLVTAKNVRSESMDYVRTDFVPRQVAERCWRRCKPQNGDVLMVSVGATLGRLCVLKDPIEMVLVRSVTLLRPAAGAVDVNYLALHLMSPKTQAEIWASVKQSAQPCLYLAKSAALRIALPPLREQERIVARVFQLRRLCTDLRQRLTASLSTQSHLAETLVAEVA